MKKRMFAALLAVSMMIGMTACGSDNSSAGNSASGSSTETARQEAMLQAAGVDEVTEQDQTAAMMF